MGLTNLDTIFHPDSIAVIGASEKAGSIGRAVMTNLIDGGFDEKVFAVNPNHDRLFDQRAYANVADTPTVPDLAVIAIPLSEAVQSEIKPETKADLDQAAQKIGDRPQARLPLCWNAVPAEPSESSTRSFSDEEPPGVAHTRLLELAESRTESVHSYFASKGVETDRLVLCAPAIEKNERRTQVELAL